MKKFLTIFADLNRELSISPEYVPLIVRRLQNTELAAITISVIYNICSDYGRV